MQNYSVQICETVVTEYIVEARSKEQAKLKVISEGEYTGKHELYAELQDIHIEQDNTLEKEVS